MKLSEAIRKGAALHRQAFGVFRVGTDRPVATCALGAAYEAIKGELPPNNDEVVFPVIAACDGYNAEKLVPCPADSEDCHDRWVEAQSSVFAMVMHLNDMHEWSRQCIALWLEEQGL
jgi:hypothetical protein